MKEDALHSTIYCFNFKTEDPTYTPLKNTNILTQRNIVFAK